MTKDEFWNLQNKSCFILNILWFPKKDQWEENYSELITFHRKYNHVNVSRSHKGMSKLAEWLTNNRKYYHEGSLSQERIKKLEMLGIIWDFKENQWNEKCELLAQFQKKYGHVNVSSRDEHFSELANWVRNNRRYYQEGKLSQERVKKLEALGIVWSLKKDQWLGNYEAVSKFYRKFGHINIPRTSKEFGKLSDWLHTNRKYYHEGELSQDRIKRLEALGMIWAPKEEQWIERFNQLEKFKKKYGHYNVSTRDKAWPGLGDWLYNNKKYYRQGKLSGERIKKLQALGVELDVSMP